MTVCFIKKNDNVTRKVFDVLVNKKRQVQIKNKIRALLQHRLQECCIPFDDLEDFDQVAEELEIAPIDLRRTKPAVMMALSESMLVDVLLPDGNTGKSIITISFNGSRLSNSFKSFASGQLRKQVNHPIFGDFLSNLYQPRHSSFDLAIHCQWKDEAAPTAKVDRTTKSTNIWFLDAVDSLALEVVALLNQEVQQHV